MIRISNWQLTSKITSPQLGTVATNKNREAKRGCSRVGVVVGVVENISQTHLNLSSKGEGRRG